MLVLVSIVHIICTIASTNVSITNSGHSQSYGVGVSTINTY